MNIVEEVQYLVTKGRAYIIEAVPECDCCLYKFRGPYKTKKDAKLRAKAIRQDHKDKFKVSDDKVQLIIFEMDFEQLPDKERIIIDHDVLICHGFVEVDENGGRVSDYECIDNM